MAGSKDDLIDLMDKYYLELLSEAKGEVVGATPIGFLDKLKVFSEGRAWVAVKNKVVPDDDTDAFSEARAKLVNRSRGSRSSATTNGRA